MGAKIKRGADGLYTVCFKNYKAYSEAKIWEVFGRYGQVMSIRFVCDGNTGLVFVRYKDYIAIKNCLDDMKETKELYVRVAFSSKPPQHEPKQQSGSMCKPYARSMDSHEDISVNRRNSGSHCSSFKKDFHMNFKHNGGQRKKILPKPEYRHPENDDSSVSREGPRQNNEQNTENEVPKYKKSLKGEILSGYSEHELDDTTEMKSDGGTKIKSNILHVGNEDSLKNSHSSDQIYQSNEASNDVTDDGPPPLVDFEDIPDLIDERPKVYAKDVIIANLPPAADVSYICHLARSLSLNPVHISPIETTGIRYNLPFCHLWVENDYDAEIAVSELKGTYMEGKKLLVVRAEELLNGII